MCGLFAVLSRREAITKDYGSLLDGLKHRGPDDRGSCVVSLSCAGTQTRARAWLGHRRLSIIDLSERGRQPMASPDGRYVIIFNGEIYNFIELRKECRAAGADFATNTDTEVLLQAWRLWGDQCLMRLKGMFAFAIIDRFEGRATLARDFFGIKPMYYAVSDEAVVVASEILPIVRTGVFSERLNATQVYEYLRFGATNSCDETILRDVHALPPAHLATFDFVSGQLQAPRQYWALRITEQPISFEDAVAECRDRFLENVKLHLRSDVPIGAALSGGLDSSAVVCAVHRLEPDLNLQTFSYIASDPAMSEERWVDLVHQQVGGLCHKIRPKPTDLAADLELLVRRQGEPFGSASMYAQFRVFQHAREQGVAVTLDGQGADELLGGYWPHVGSYAAEHVRAGRFKCAMDIVCHAAPGNRGALTMLSMLAQSMLPGPARSFARRLAGRSLFPSYLNAAWFEAQGVSWRLVADHLVGRFETLKEHLVATVERGSLPNLLRYADRNSMAFSIESRVPFLTHDFSEFLMSLPPEYLISPMGVRKHVFREAMGGIVPEEIRLRPDKIGFVADDGLWIRSNAAEFRNVLDRLRTEPMFKENRLGVFIEKFLAGRHQEALLVWRILIFGVWLQELRVARAAT